MNKKFFMISLLLAQAAFMNAHVEVTVNETPLAENETYVTRAPHTSETIEIKTHNLREIINIGKAYRDGNVPSDVMTRFSPEQWQAFLDFARTLENLLQDPDFVSFISNLFLTGGRSYNDAHTSEERIVRSLEEIDPDAVPAERVVLELDDIYDNHNFKECMNAYRKCLQAGVRHIELPEIVSALAHKYDSDTFAPARIIITHKHK